jgi:hypothetical protein
LVFIVCITSDGNEDSNSNAIMLALLLIHTLAGT